MDLHLVYITAKDEKEAKKIAKKMVKDDLAVCVNMHESFSIYKWEGELKEEPEYTLFAKVRGSRLQELTETVKKMHSYECPCIISLPIEGGNKDYLDWLAG